MKVRLREGDQLKFGYGITVTVDSFRGHEVVIEFDVPAHVIVETVRQSDLRNRYSEEIGGSE